MLIRDTIEVQEIIPISMGTNAAAFNGFIDLAESKYIIDEISQEFYDELQAQYDNNTFTSAKMQKVHKLLQRAIVYFGFLEYIPSGQLHISDAGFRIQVEEHFKAAFDHQIDRLEDSFADAGDHMLDMVIQYLEENKADFATWADSDAYTVFKDRFVSTSKVFNDQVAVKISRRKFRKLRAELDRAEEDYIQPAVGEELYDELHTQHAANTLTTENKLLIKYINRACVNLALANASVLLMVGIDDMGVTTSTNSVMKVRIKQAQSDTHLSLMLQKFKKDGEDAVKKLVNYLYKNIDDYPLFEASDAYKSTRISSIDNSGFNGTYIAL